MMYRTDLALESIGTLQTHADGYSLHEEKRGIYTITTVNILTPEAAMRLQKSTGKYCTLTLPSFSDHPDSEGTGAAITAELLRSMLPEKGCVLVAGLGNRALTADALGPQTADKVFATRHIHKELCRIADFPPLRSVSVCSPGVLGTTGLDTQEILCALVQQIHPAAVIAVDALAAASHTRLGCTVQITDSGIAPGSGVGNSRPKLNRELLGIPVIGMGVPTVMDGNLFTEEETEVKLSSQKKEPAIPLTVTVREIDLLISRAAAMLSMAINKALNPAIEEHWFWELAK